MRAVGLAALAAGIVVIAVVLGSDHQDDPGLWAGFSCAVGWSFIGTGLYAWRRRPESRTGALMIALGFAWFLFTLQASDVPAVYTLALTLGGLWGSVFLHLGITFPGGRIANGAERAIVLAGYVVFPFAPLPSLLFAGPEELGCDECPANLLLIRADETLATVLRGAAALAYLTLFVVVFARAIRKWRAASAFERIQLTPVYICALGTFLLVTAAQAGGGDPVWWAAFVATALLPFAFLGGLLRSRLSELNAELHVRLEELRASRARLVEAGDAERRRLERDLHDGAQARLVGLALLLTAARKRAAGDPPLAALLDRAHEELQTGLGELRELARGIHPAVLTDHGLAPALEALAARTPVPVRLDADAGAERLPGPVESAAYFVVSEALTNVTKYAQASRAAVTIRRADGRLRVEVGDDGVGGANAARGSGLRGLADRVAALDGTLSLDSPPGGGTRLRAEIPVAPPA
jgi:signal transduction histidine kinase